MFHVDAPAWFLWLLGVAVDGETGNLSNKHAPNKERHVETTACCHRNKLLYQPRGMWCKQAVVRTTMVLISNQPE
jgi:hypothetical protein